MLNLKKNKLQTNLFLFKNIIAFFFKNNKLVYVNFILYK